MTALRRVQSDKDELLNCLDLVHVDIFLAEPIKMAAAPQDTRTSPFMQHKYSFRPVKCGLRASLVSISHPARL
jgi:hypothetical protein